MLRIGGFELYSVVTGTFRLDGGAMFGAVPKVLWETVADVDTKNRILLYTRTLLGVDRSAKRVVLADTGCGTKWSQEQVERFDQRHDRDAITRQLGSLGLRDEDVTDVVVTHLHFDHNGGLSEWLGDPGGRAILRYPQARHWIHRRQWEHAANPTPKDRASYLREDIAPLAEGGVLQLVDGDQPAPPFEGLEWFISHGHTPYHLHPVFEGATHASLGRRLLFVGDLMPTVAHLRPAWVMAYDLHPLTTIREKENILRQGLEAGWLLAFAHDPTTAGVAIGGTVDRPVVARALDL